MSDPALIEMVDSLEQAVRGLVVFQTRGDYGFVLTSLIALERRLKRLKEALR